MSQADAEERVDETYADLKAAEQKARDAAEAARKTAIIAAFLGGRDPGDRLCRGLCRCGARRPSSRRAHGSGLPRLDALLVSVPK